MFSVCGTALLCPVPLNLRLARYIKEFVHSDFGRTVPSLGSYLNADVDILELDVEVRCAHTTLDWHPIFVHQALKHLFYAPFFMLHIALFLATLEKSLLIGNVSVWALMLQSLTDVLEGCLA